MKVAPEQQDLAQEMGKGIWFLNNNFFELFQDAYDVWHVNATWGDYMLTKDYFTILDDIKKEGMQINQRHFDAIERVNAPTEAKGEQSPIGCCKPYACEAATEEEDKDELGAAETILFNLIAAREVADEEINMGFVTDSITGDTFKVSVQYIGNRGND